MGVTKHNRVFLVRVLALFKKSGDERISFIFCPLISNLFKCYCLMTANTMAVLKSCKHALLKSYMQATIVGNLLSPNRASLATTEAEKRRQFRQQL